MITWPVYDPGNGGLGDLYGYAEYELEFEVTDEDIVEDRFGPDDPTVVMPASRLVERCQTSAALRSAR